MLDLADEVEALLDRSQERMAAMRPLVERVPADWLLPYVHQRYDDLSVLGKRS